MYIYVKIYFCLFVNIISFDNITYMSVRTHISFRNMHFAIVNVLSRLGIVQN